MNQPILNLLELQGVDVIDVYDATNGGKIVEIVCHKPDPCPCGHGRWHRHGRLAPRQVSHQWVGVHWVHLRWTPQRWRCTACRRTVVDRPGQLRPWQRLTPVAQAAALLALQRGSFRGTAAMLGVGPGVLRRLVDRVVPLETPRWWDVPGDLVLSVDEHSFRGTDLCITLAMQAPVRRLITVLTDDRIRTWDAWWQTVPASVRARVRVGTCDLKASYRKGFERWGSDQLRVVADPFHVVHDANRRLDDIRRLEQQETGHAIPRWPLVKAQERLTPRQAAALTRIRQQFPALGALHALKESLRDFWAQPTRADAEQHLSRWLINADACDHAEGRVWAGLIRRWKPTLLAHWDQPERWTNGYLEGLHTKMKQLKRVSYGFRNRDRYRRKMLLGFLPSSGIPQLLT
ncbi:ISL3 family transposase [Sulfobacillus harzensis]|uniref:ISL3 family transposase n=1 Tax=Sulfobacillus harzensis TaxID=2729629 RepID=A0A7Y0L5Y1_9FIRM|nr:ISL3 family transposase [Sulfobacillus harzensis]NMP23892.1 ISL3 family transposase [Sulfobacillus harzensis]